MALAPKYQEWWPEYEKYGAEYLAETILGVSVETVEVPDAPQNTGVEVADAANQIVVRGDSTPGPGLTLGAGAAEGDADIVEEDTTAAAPAAPGPQYVQPTWSTGTFGQTIDPTRGEYTSPSITEQSAVEDALNKGYISQGEYNRAVEELGRLGFTTLYYDALVSKPTTPPVAAAEAAAPPAKPPVEPAVPEGFSRIRNRSQLDAALAAGSMTREQYNAAVVAFTKSGYADVSLRGAADTTEVTYSGDMLGDIVAAAGANDYDKIAEILGQGVFAPPTSIAGSVWLNPLTNNYEWTGDTPPTPGSQEAADFARLQTDTQARALAEKLLYLSVGHELSVDTEAAMENLRQTNRQLQALLEAELGVQNQKEILALQSKQEKEMLRLRYALEVEHATELRNKGYEIDVALIKLRDKLDTASAKDIAEWQKELQLEVMKQQFEYDMDKAMDMADKGLEIDKEFFEFRERIEHADAKEILEMQQKFEKEILAERFRLEAAAFTAEGEVNKQYAEELQTLIAKLSTASAIEIRQAEAKLQLETERRREEQQTIQLPTEAVKVEQLRATVGNFTKEYNDILSMAPGANRLAATQALLSKFQRIGLPSEVRWDPSTGEFANAPGFEGRQRSPEVIEYLRQARPLFEGLAAMQVTMQRDVQLRDELSMAQQKVEQEAALFRQYMKTDEIDSAEEALARQRVAERETSELQKKLLPMEMLQRFLANPTTLALARHYGILASIEEALDIKIPFGQNMTTTDGHLPSLAVWKAMTGYERLIASEDWKSSNGGTDDDFMRAMQSQVPGGMRGATRYTRA